MSKEGWYFQFQLALKRALDIAVAAAGLFLLLPVYGAIALAIKLDSPGPVIYRHRRVGKDGKPFYLFKFRSMSASGDDSGYMEYLKQLIESERDNDGKALPYRKLTSDPRVTRVGKVLRTYYLDELPQIWNILLGDMSLVGPRPHVQFEVDHYTPHQRKRLRARPGATGLWQVTGKADCTFNELIELDLQYIKNWHLMLDVLIVLQTMALMLRGGEGFWARMAKTIPVRSASSLTGAYSTGIPSGATAGKSNGTAPRGAEHPFLAELEPPQFQSGEDQEVIVSS